MSRLIAIALLFIIAGCGDEFRNHTECRKVAGIIEDMSDERSLLRAMDQMDDLTSQEMMLFVSIVYEDADPYTLCMEINR